MGSMPRQSKNSLATPQTGYLENTSKEENNRFIQSLRVDALQTRSHLSKRQ
jgi:hypothetical protein